MNAFVIVMNYIQIQTQKWLRIAFLNLLIVALLGGLMRYKIAYSLPFIDQRNFMNAHSHFGVTFQHIQKRLVTLDGRVFNDVMPVIHRLVIVHAQY